MAEKFLFVVDPLESLNPKTDTSLAILEEACRRGIHCYACELQDIFLLDGALNFWVSRVELSHGYKTPPEYEGPKAIYKASQFDVIFMRKDPPVDQEFIAALTMMRCHDKTKGLLVILPMASFWPTKNFFAKVLLLNIRRPPWFQARKRLFLTF